MKQQPYQNGVVLILTAIIFLIFGLTPIQPVLADVAPPPPPEGANIQPNQPTQVRMMAETVLVEIAATTGKQSPFAKVTASFTMRNLGDQEESFDVRFPLNLLYPQYQSDIEECPYPEGGFPQITSFRAKVNGKQANVTTTYKHMNDPYGSQPAKDVACWANFPVTFPTQKDVSIEVSYTAEGYFAWSVNGLVEFPYVMVTGEGWAGTIGTADITIRAPYEVTPQTLMDYSPQPATVVGREIRWHFEDEEPGSNISATLVNPALWARIDKERQTVEKNPQDGEAWGRLGKAYKETILLNRGFRWDEGGPELYQLSREAYESSVTLLPRDADWHYGYGELLWWNASYPTFGSNTEIRDDLVKAAEQFSLALKINPGHSKTLEILDTWSGFGTGPDSLVDLSAARPVFLVLTTTPTVNPTQIKIPTETLAPAATQTLPNPSSTATEAAIADATGINPQTPQAPQSTTPAPAESKPEPTPAPSGTSSGRKICGAGLFPLGGAAVLAGWKKRSWQKQRKANKICFL